MGLYSVTLVSDGYPLFAELAHNSNSFCPSWGEAGRGGAARHGAVRCGAVSLYSVTHVSDGYPLSAELAHNPDSFCPSLGGTGRVCSTGSSETGLLEQQQWWYVLEEC